MGIKITGIALDDFEVKTGNLVLVGEVVVLVTNSNYYPNFRGVPLTSKGPGEEKLYRQSDARNFSGTVTISNK